MDGQVLAATLPRGDARRSRGASAQRRHVAGAHRRRGVRRAAAAADGRPRRTLGAGRRRRRADPAVAHRAAALPRRHSHRARGDRRRSPSSSRRSSASPSRARSRVRSRRSPTRCARWPPPATSRARSRSRHGSRWDDEDARLLATTFNTLTDSIARFQREMSQKERLSSLGRLSTVIAHEVRNPLMIIKASLHALRQPAPAPRHGRAKRSPTSTRRSTRLNRIVNEVLDFARPIRFELAPADSTRCAASRPPPREAAGAGRADRAAARSRRCRASTTDAERLRIALVNMLVNARHAVNGGRRRAAPVAPRGRRAAAPAADPPISAARDHAPRGRSRQHRHRRPRRRHRARGPRRASSTRTSRPSAAAPASACRSPRTSSGARRHDRRRERAGAGTDDPHRPARCSTPAQRRSDSMTTITRLHPARRRRREDSQGARPRAARRRPRRRRDDQRARGAAAARRAHVRPASSSTT